MSKSKERITIYLLENNIAALCELLSKGKSQCIRQDMFSQGFTLEESESVIAVLEAINTFPNIDRLSESTKEAMRKIEERVYKKN